MIIRKKLILLASVFLFMLLFLPFSSALGSSERVSFLCAKAKDFYARNQYENALSEFAKVLEADSRNPTAKEYINRIFQEELSKEKNRVFLRDSSDPLKRELQDASSFFRKWDDQWWDWFKGDCKISIRGLDILDSAYDMNHLLKFSFQRYLNQKKNWFLEKNQDLSNFDFFQRMEHLISTWREFQFSLRQGAEGLENYYRQGDWLTKVKSIELYFNNFIGEAKSILGNLDYSGYLNGIENRRFEIDNDEFRDLSLFKIESLYVAYRGQILSIISELEDIKLDMPEYRFNFDKEKDSLREYYDALRNTLSELKKAGKSLLDASWPKEELSSLYGEVLGDVSRQWSRVQSAFKGLKDERYFELLGYNDEPILSISRGYGELNLVNKENEALLVVFQELGEQFKLGIDLPEGSVSALYDKDNKLFEMDWMGDRLKLKCGGRGGYLEFKNFDNSIQLNIGEPRGGRLPINQASILLDDLRLSFDNTYFDYGFNDNKLGLYSNSSPYILEMEINSDIDFIDEVKERALGQLDDVEITGVKDLSNLKDIEFEDIDLKEELKGIAKKTIKSVRINPRELTHRISSGDDEFNQLLRILAMDNKEILLDSGEVVDLIFDPDETDILGVIEEVGMRNFEDVIIEAEKRAFYNLALSLSEEENFASKSFQSFFTTGREAISEAGKYGFGFRQGYLDMEVPLFDGCSSSNLNVKSEAMNFYGFLDQNLITVAGVNLDMKGLLYVFCLPNDISFSLTNSQDYRSKYLDIDYDTDIEVYRIKAEEGEFVGFPGGYLGFSLAPDSRDYFADFKIIPYLPLEVSEDSDGDIDIDFVDEAGIFSLEYANDISLGTEQKIFGRDFAILFHKDVNNLYSVAPKFEIIPECNIGVEIGGYEIGQNDRLKYTLDTEVMDTDLGFFIDRNNERAIRRIGGSLGRNLGKNKITFSVSRVNWQNADIWEKVGEDYSVSLTNSDNSKKIIFSLYNDYIADKLDIFNGYEFCMGKDKATRLLLGAEIINIDSGSSDSAVRGTVKFSRLF